MTRLLHFMAMGGYARYLWPCYGLSAAVVLLNIEAARRSLRLAQQEARRRLTAAAAGSAEAVVAVAGAPAAGVPAAQGAAR